MILSSHFLVDKDSTLILEVEVPEPLCEAIMREIECNQKVYASIGS